MNKGEKEWNNETRKGNWKLLGLHFQPGEGNDTNRKEAEIWAPVCPVRRSTSALHAL